MNQREKLGAEVENNIRLNMPPGIIIGTVRIVRLTYNEGSDVALGYVLEIVN